MAVLHAWVQDEGLLEQGETCGFQTYPGSVRNFEPPEWCENDVVPGSEFCTLHAEGDEPDPDDYYDDGVDYGPYSNCYESDFDNEYTRDCD